MKILHIENGKHLYGGARQVIYLVEQLSRYPLEQLVVCPDNSELVVETKKHCRTVQLKMGGDADFGYLYRLVSLIRREKPDLIHVHSRKGDLIAGLAARIADTPCLISRRVDNREPQLLRALKYPLFRKVVTISEGIHRVMLDQGIPAGKIHCAQSAVDSDLFRPGKRNREVFFKRFQLSPESRPIGIVAQMIPRKGHILLFQALPELLKKYPTLQLLVFGQGPMEAELKQAVQELNIGRTVHFVGFQRDMDTILPNLELVIHPAYIEGLGVSLLEAAASGVPLVGCATGGIPEVITDGVNGFLTRPGNSQDLIHACDRILANPNIASQFSTAGRQRIEQKFDVASMAGKNFRIYQAALTNRRRWPAPGSIQPI